MDFYKAFTGFVDQEKIGRKQAVFYNGRATTYGELIEEADRVASALTSAGVKKGDVVCIYMGNCTQFLSIFLGVAKSGAIAEPVNILLTEYEVKPQLEQTKPKALFVSPAHLPVIEKIRPHFPKLDNIILMSGEAGEGVLSYSEFLKNGAGTQPASGIAENDVVLILFTAGTTGVPKGVMLTHKNLLSVIQGQRNRFGPLGEMVTLCAAPLSHIFGLNTITFASLFRKSCVVLQEWFQTNETAKLIESCRVSCVMGVPTMVKSLVDAADEFDMKSLNLILCGAAPVPEELYHSVERAFHCMMVEGWGLTEGTGNTTATPPGVQKIGSCGIPFDGIGVECAIVDEKDNIMPPGQVGELVQRGSLTMKGYLGNPEATAETLKNGWLHTGDLARTDEDGYIYIVDRKKDVIIRGGFNIYPAEVESAIYTHPSVMEAAVFGVSDERKGETVAAAIMPKAGMKVTEGEIAALCQERLARYKIPKHIKIMEDPLPKSATGKILRRVLKDDFEKDIKINA
jgi:acyl-CoA synthetase (AMP-forming)/AMP-acid ligase II